MITLSENAKWNIRFLAGSIFVWLICNAILLVVYMLCKSQKINGLMCDGTNSRLNAVIQESDNSATNISEGIGN